MYQPAKIPKNSRKVQQLSKLESEHQRNQDRIRQLHQRNRQIESEVRHLSGQSLSPQPTPINTSSKTVKLRSPKPKSLRRIGFDFLAVIDTIKVGRYSLLFWLQVAGMMILVAIGSGAAGFLLTRIIASFFN